jgi:hypothetical protein
MNWEKWRIQGESLLTIAYRREEAIAKLESCKKMQKWVHSVSFLMLLCLIVIAFIHDALFGQLTNVQKTIFFIAPISLLLLVLVYKTIQLPKNEGVISGVISECNGTLVEFIDSVDSLNPLHTGNRFHDEVNLAYVSDRLHSLAFRVLDAQASFEVVCKREPLMRYDVIHAGNWVEKCETNFEQVWEVATVHFSLGFDKNKIFETARLELARRR